VVDLWFQGVLEVSYVIVLIVHHIDLGAAAAFMGEMTHVPALEAWSLGWLGMLVVLASLSCVASELVAEPAVYWCTGPGRCVHGDWLVIHV
jgi:hypothetical protein